MKILKRLLIGFIVLSVIVVTGLTLLLQRSLPKTKGQMQLIGLTDTVEVIRDQKGIPTIIAQNESDLYKAQGFIQAQDRLFQMDLARRQASGRLSEIFGEVALENDKKFLIFSLRMAAEKSYEIYSPEAKQVLQDYADGVNAYIDYAIKNHRLPYEFLLLGYKPEPWTPIDSLTIGKYMAYDLGGHWSYQAFNNWTLNTLGETVFKEMNSIAIEQDDDIDDIIRYNQQATLRIDQKAMTYETPHLDNGSNNWVVSGLKTESGKPLLADDPHLSLSTPSIWYQMTLQAPTLHVSGVIFAGIPGIILGHNEEVAWGVTNYGPDVQDLYIEKQNPDNKYEFEYDGSYYQADVKDYKLKVKGKDPISFEVIYTKNGPIINDLLQVKHPETKETKALETDQLFSMRWTAFEATKELEAILMINKASNWQEFEKGLEEFKVPAQNFVFADQKGNIAFKANGIIPIRKKGNGVLPVPGYLSEYAWSGYIPFETLPKIENPESGFIATANTSTTPDYPYFVSNVWAQPYRKQRIDEVLSETKKFTYQDMQALQMDVENLYAREFLKDMLKHTNVSEEEQEVITILENWNLQDDKDLAAPLIFHTWMMKLREVTYRPWMDEYVYHFMPHKEHYTDELLRKAFRNESLEVFHKQGGIEEVLTASLKETISTLKQKYGKNVQAWKWGDGHKLLFKNSLSAASPILAYLLNPKTHPISGSKITVQAASQNEKGIVDHGASWRFVYDFMDNAAYHIVGPGQSGHFMSKYYKNQIKNWVDGTYTKQSFQEEAVGSKLTLKP